MKFAYITFVNHNLQYMNLLKTTINSVLLFSKNTLIIYLVKIPHDIAQDFFPESPRIIYRHVDYDLPSIFYYKPSVIIDALNQGLESGLYIEADDVLTPNCDDVESKLGLVGELPLPQLHPNETHKPSDNFMNKLGVYEKTQSYIHAAHILFKSDNLPFFQEWLDMCMLVSGENWDESALNCLYWKYKCKDYYLPHLSPWYETFYSEYDFRQKAYSYHGCKNPALQEKLFNDMLTYYTSTKDKLQKELYSFQNIWKGGYFNNIESDSRKLQNIIDVCITPHVTDQTTVLEIGCGRGAWTKHMKHAKKIYCMDALSAEHNNFWNYVGRQPNIEYYQVDDFTCKNIPDNSIDFLFSYDVFCHISYSGMREYMKNLYPKLKKDAVCFIMVADSEKYQKFGIPGVTPGYSSHEEEVKDYDGNPSDGRWYWYGVNRFCQVLEDFTYHVISKDINVIERDPITKFTK